VSSFLLPLAHWSPQPKRQTDQSQLFLHCSHQSVVGYIGATWRIRLKLCTCHMAKTIELVLPSANPSPQLKGQIDWFSCFCTAHGRYFTMGAPFHGRSALPSNAWFTGTNPANNPNGISIGSAVFAQMVAECPYTLQWEAPSPSKLPLSTGDLDANLDAWFLGPTWVLNSNSISIGSAVFAGLTSVTDRPTDQPTDRPRYSVGNNKPHLRM